MSQDAQLDMLAEFTATQADLEAARARVTTIKAEWMKTAGSGELSAEAEQLKNELETALGRVAELEAESKAKSERMGYWRREANMSRKELGIKQDWMTILTEEEYLKKLAAAQGDSTLEVAPESGGKRKRKAFEVIKDFDPEKHLTKREREIRAGMLKQLDSWWATYWEPLSRGMQPGSVSKENPKGVPLIDGTMHLMNMRNVGHYDCVCALMVMWWGDPEGLERSKKLTRLVWDPKTMATGHSPSATVRMVKYKGKDVSDEQKGLRRFNYQRVDKHEASKADFFGADKRHDLESDLELATCALLETMYDENDGCETEFELIHDYCNDRHERLVFTGETNAPNLPWYVEGKSLTHPARSRHFWHRLRARRTGSKEEDKAARFYGRKLAADIDYIKIGNGLTIAVGPHYTKALQDERKQDTSKGMEFQDSTYPREENPLEEMLRELNDPDISDEYLAGQANNLHNVVMYAGPKDGGVSACLGGYDGTKKFEGANGVIYKGELFGPSRWKNFRPDEKEGIHVVTRGLMTVSSYRGTDKKQCKLDLEYLSECPDARGYSRYGAYVGLMFFERDSRIEG